MMTLEEVWENLRQDPETKATMEEAEKSYKLFKKIENLIVSDLETKLAKGVEIINEWMQLNFEKSVKINQLEHQLEDKEKEETKRMEDFEKGCQEYYKSNQRVIDELEKVKEYIREFVGINDVKFICTTTITNQIDQQITELKGEK